MRGGFGRQSVDGGPTFSVSDPPPDSRILSNAVLSYGNTLFLSEEATGDESLPDFPNCGLRVSDGEGFSRSIGSKGASDLSRPVCLVLFHTT